MPNLPDYYTLPLATAYSQCTELQQRTLRRLLLEASKGKMLRAFLRPHLQHQQPPQSVVEEVKLKEAFVHANTDTIGLLPWLLHYVANNKKIDSIKDLCLDLLDFSADVLANVEATEPKLRNYTKKELDQRQKIIEQAFPELKPAIAELYQERQVEKADQELSKKRPRRGEPIH